MFFDKSNVRYTAFSGILPLNKGLVQSPTKEEEKYGTCSATYKKRKEKFMVHCYGWDVQVCLVADLLHIYLNWWTTYSVGWLSDALSLSMSCKKSSRYLRFWSLTELIKNTDNSNGKGMSLYKYKELYKEFDKLIFKNKYNIFLNFFVGTQITCLKKQTSYK